MNARLADRYMYVFGGFDGSNWRNDVAALNVDTLEWTSLTPEPYYGADSRPVPSPRAAENGSAANTAPSAPKPTAPGPRASACACLMDSNKVVLFGGYDGSEFCNVRDASVSQTAPSVLV